jgi:hypothetical protein
MTRTLKRQPSAIVPNMPPHRLAVYGDGGVGKTTLLLSYPNPLVIDTDGGLEGDAVADLKGHAEAWYPEKWADLSDLYFWLKSEVKKKGYKTIGVDSIDTLARMLRFESTDIGNKSRGDDAWMDDLVTSELQDYGRVSDAVARFLGNLMILSREQGVHIVLTSAVKLPDKEKGRFKRTFDVNPAIEADLKHWCNIYGEMVLVETNDGGKKDAKGEKVMVEHRILWTKGSDPARQGKTRFGALRPGVTDPTFDGMRKKIEARAVAPATPKTTTPNPAARKKAI